MGEELVKVGDVPHYYIDIGVAVIGLTDTLRLGDEIAVRGATTNLIQVVESMQIEHEDVEEARAGDQAFRIKEQTTP